MSRGVKFNFSPGENVLCFEPDPTKARVLYEAKILDTTVYRDVEGKRQPGYHIHFLRWNNSWDRVVGEVFVLKNTETNRDLMKQLADVARKVSKNRTRRKKIGDILAKAFEGKPPPFESDSEDSDDAETTDTTDTNDMTDESAAETDSLTSDHRTEEQKRKFHANIKLDIPDSLKAVLDKDFFAITQDKKMVKLPAEISVITVLESFVKRFILDFWGPNFDRSHFCHIAPKIAVERLVPMCKEFVDGLRICFDFLLPLILLYGAEKNQYSKISSQFKHRSPVKPKIQTGDSPLIHSNRPGDPDQLLSGDEPLPKLPKLSPNLIQNDDSEISFPHHQILTPRRMTRRQFQESLKKPDEEEESKSDNKVKHKSAKKDKHKDEKECIGKSLRTRRSSDRQDETPVRRRALRNHRKSSDASTESDQSKTETIQSEPVKTVNIKTEKADRPPPLLLPCNLPPRTNTNGVGDNKGPGGEKGAPGSVDSLGDSGKEEIVEEIMTWQLMSPEVQTRVPTLPSALYGPQHLLRLFVKLPELLGKMEMDENRLGVLLKLLQQFLLYMADHTVELFSDAAYVRASEA